MTDEEEEFAEASPIAAVEAFLTHLAEEVEALSGVLIIAEIVNKDGTPDLLVWKDYINGLWRHNGMLNYAWSIMQQEDEITFEFAEDEDED